MEAVRQQLADLEAQFQAEVDGLEAKIDPMTEALQTVAVKPKKTGITVGLVALAWVPCWLRPDGNAEPAWE